MCLVSAILNLLYSHHSHQNCLKHAETCFKHVCKTVIIIVIIMMTEINWKHVHQSLIDEHQQKFHLLEKFCMNMFQAVSNISKQRGKTQGIHAIDLIKTRQK